MALIAALAFIAWALPGCKATLPTKVLPPAELIQDCPETEVDLSTNGGLANKILSLKQDLKVCNIDKAALRAWAGE